MMRNDDATPDEALEELAALLYIAVAGEKDRHKAYWLLRMARLARACAEVRR